MTYWFNCGTTWGYEAVSGTPKQQERPKARPVRPKVSVWVNPKYQ